jgi:DNA-binding PadR family transcriptional regulator
VANQPKLSAPTRLVLAALAAHPGAWRHGYDLSRETGLTSGTLYPLLSRLADYGWLESEWRQPVQAGRPPRHAYRLTADGLAFARTLAPATAKSRRAARGLKGAAT